VHHPAFDAAARVRRAAQLTLPTEVRRALNVKEGDYLEARVLKEGVLLTPVAIVDRPRALASLREATSQVKRRSGARALSDRDIAREVKRSRRTDA
jgi:AbrB family looped-hinge helix DNA binding protein